MSVQRTVVPPDRVFIPIIPSPVRMKGTSVRTMSVLPAAAHILQKQMEQRAPVMAWNAPKMFAPQETVFMMAWRNRTTPAERFWNLVLLITVCRQRAIKAHVPVPVWSAAASEGEMLITRKFSHRHWLCLSINPRRFFLQPVPVPTVIQPVVTFQIAAARWNTRIPGPVSVVVTEEEVRL